MNRFLFLLGFILFSFTPHAYCQDYFSNLVSNLNKSHSAEATVSLGAYKSSLTGCLMINQGSESKCKDSITFQPTSNFDYSFSILPKDGSQVWAIKASGKGNYSANDAVILTSDDAGNVTCASTGKMSGSC